MGITTTTSIKADRDIRCDRCGKKVRGNVALIDDNFRRFGVCCATGVNREILLSMIDPDSPEPEGDEPVLIGHDPLDPKHGWDLRALKALQEAGENLTLTRQRLWPDGSLASEEVQEMRPVDKIMEEARRAKLKAIAFPLVSGEDEIEPEPGGPVAGLRGQKPLGPRKR